MKLLRITTISGSLNTLIRGQLGYLRQQGVEVVGAASDNGTGRLQEVAEREGIRTIDVPMHRDISLMADCRSLWTLIRLMRRERPDIVHVNTPKASLLGMVASWVTRRPVRIYTVTGLRFETAGGNRRRILKLMERIACRCATRVVPEGDGVARTLRHERITSKPLQKLHNGNINGIDTCYFSAGSAPTGPTGPTGPNSPNPPFTFIFIGRMVRDKGINELVQAFTRLSEERPGRVRLLLLGNFEDKLDPISPDTRQKMVNCPDIVYEGFQKDIRPFLEQSQCLVLPSYREGFPNVLLQAGAMGRAIITSDVNGADEVVTPGHNGLIIPRRSAKALYDAMVYMLDHPDEWAAMCANARQAVASRFDQRDVWAATLEMYRQEFGRIAQKR